MAFFSYTVINPQGKKSNGFLQAESKKEAQKHLAHKQLLVVELKEEKQASFPSLPKKKILIFFEQLSRLLHAGLPLIRSLTLLYEKNKDKASQTLLLDLMQRIKQGESLSSAMQRHADTFDAIYIQMIRNGEEQGNLSYVVKEIATNMRQQMQLTQKITGALVYPLLLITFCTIVVSTLLFYVVPSLAPLFEGRELHLLTQSVLWVSDAACQSSSILLISIGLLLTGNIAAFYTSKGKKMVRMALFHIPIVRKQLMKIGAVRFSKSMHSLLLSGMPLVNALSHSADILSYPYLISLVERLKEKILEGRSLSSSLQESPAPFHEMGKMMAIAEESGDMATMFNHIARTHQEELEESVQRFTSLLQPILLLSLGLVIGCVVLAILLPLCDAGTILDF